MKKTFAFDYSRAVVSAAKKLGVQTHVFARGPESEMYVRCSKDQCKSISAAAGSGPNWSSKKKIGALLEEGGEFSDDAAGLREYVAAVCLDEVALAMASPRARPRFSTPGKGCALINAIRGVLGLAPLEGDPSTSGPPLIYTGFPEKPGYNVEGGFRLFDKRLFGDGGRGGRDVEEMMNQNESEEKTCSACAYSFMEPDGPLCCGHKDSGPFGLSLRRGPPQHCGPDRARFEQHPLRSPSGELKPRP